MGTFEIKAVKDGGLMFNLKAANGQVIGTSEVYNKRASLDTGIASVQTNAPIAPIEDQTAEKVEAQKCPKFEVFADKAGKPLLPPEGEKRRNHPGQPGIRGHQDLPCRY